MSERHAPEYAQKERTSAPGLDSGSADDRLGEPERNTITEEARARFLRDGFALAPDLLSTEQIESLRRVCLEFFASAGVPYDGGMTQSDAFSKIPEIRWLLTNHAILDTFRGYCGKPLAYCHHSDVHLNKYTGWHKDACGDDDYAMVDGEQYAVYKMAFYLEDHRSGRPALSVRAGSHRSPGLHVGALTELRPNAGDAILFDCRLSHAGVRLPLLARVTRTLIPSQRWRTRILSRARRLRQEPDRLAIFFTLGRPNRFLREHVNRTVARQLRQNNETHYAMANGLIDTLRRAGLVWTSPSL